MQPKRFLYILHHLSIMIKLLLTWNDYATHHSTNVTITHILSLLMLLLLWCIRAQTWSQRYKCSPADMKKGIRNLPLITLSRKDCNVVPSKGRAPHTSTYKTTPILWKKKFALINPSRMTLILATLWPQGPIIWNNSLMLFKHTKSPATSLQLVPSFVCKNVWLWPNFHPS